MEDRLLKALLKRALGYTYKEVQEEFSVGENGELTLTKRRVADKYFPPDSQAMKAYIELSQNDLSKLSDEELEKEKIRLLKQLKDNDKKE